MALIEMASHGLRPLLRSYYECQARPETYSWPNKIASEIAGKVDVIKSPSGDRAVCPLCRGESDSQYETGFSVPVGLVRHLTGSGNVRACTVMAAALSLARDYWNENFSHGEHLTAVEKGKLQQKRLATETLFSPGPDAKPELYDEKSPFEDPRNQAEKLFALSRLEALHFTPLKVENVESFVDEREQYIVYADPRAKGNIDFKVYRRAAISAAKGSKAKFALIGNYRIPDRWKNDLEKKYQAWLSMAIAKYEEKLTKPKTSA
ncbi:MAG: hypothetical protein V4723_03140 [Pseudomonadota bacterium]